MKNYNNIILVNWTILMDNNILYFLRIMDLELNNFYFIDEYLKNMKQNANIY